MGVIRRRYSLWERYSLWNSMDSATWRDYKSPRGLEALANSVLVVRISLILAKCSSWLLGVIWKEIVLQETNMISNAMTCLVFACYYWFYRNFAKVLMVEQILLISSPMWICSWGFTMLTLLLLLLLSTLNLRAPL